MLISQAFPSEFLKASDLQDKQVRVIMGHTEMKDLGQDSKPALFFERAEFEWFPKDKALILNKTNSNNIGMIYGDDTDDWTGKELILYPTMVDFQGRTVPAIRVRVPPPPKAPQRDIRPPNGTVRHTSARQELNDEIPF